MIEKRINWLNCLSPQIQVKCHHDIYIHLVPIYSRYKLSTNPYWAVAVVVYREFENNVHYFELGSTANEEPPLLKIIPQIRKCLEQHFLKAEIHTFQCIVWQRIYWLKRRPIFLKFAKMWYSVLDQLVIMLSIF